jgi:hypothetical protein
MKDKQMIDEIEGAFVRANPVPAEDLAAAARTAEASALFHHILGTRPGPETHHIAGTWTPRTRAGAQTRRVWFGAGVAVTAAAAAAFTTIAISSPVSTQESRTPGATAGALAPGLPAHLVDFTRPNGRIVVKITDPDAPVSQLDAIFQAHGLHIKINVIPVSPSLVGTIVYTDVRATRELRDRSCQMGGSGRCWVGFILPAGFHGSGNLTVGRAARPGELYESTDSAFSQGEGLHGSGLAGKPAKEALPFLRARHLGVLWMVNGSWTYSKATPRGIITRKSTSWNSTTVIIDVSGPGGQVRHPLDKIEREGIPGKTKAEQKRILDKLQQSLLRQSIAH